MPFSPLSVLLLQESNPLRDLLSQPAGNPAILAAALGTAFFLGAAHALTPGHGKALVAAYLAGTRGRIQDAVYLGVVITITHTAAVFVLGAVTLYATTLVAVERLYPFISLLSGILVAGVGLWLLLNRFRNHGHHHHHHHHHHLVGEDENLNHHGRSPAEAGHTHSNHHPHSLPTPTRGSLLSLGISGGLVPCPEALVVLLFAISLGQVGYGLLLLLSFSLGLAAILIAVGCAIVLAAPLLSRLPVDSAWATWLPKASAAFVCAIGFLLIFNAMRQI